MPKKRKIPMRMCVGCREMKPKAELMRVVKPQEGDPAVDRTGKAPGRGAYVCESVECLRLERALDAKIDEAVFEALAAQIRPREDA